MKRWVVMLEDRPTDEARQIRSDQFDRHFAFLRENFRRIVFSCGLKDAREPTVHLGPYGGLWIVEAESREEVVELYQEDPYFQLGLRGKIEVFQAHEGYI